MNKTDLKGKRVTVFGLGLSGGGTGTVAFLARAGVREIIVTDKRRREDLLPSLRTLEKIRNVTYVLGQHRPEDFTNTDLVVKNPGIPPGNEYLRLAAGKGVPVRTDSGLFFEFCANPIIGVTGTKGKTTTASMIAHILERAGVSVARIGIGREPVLGALPDIRSGDTVVFELSSWRLAGLGEVGRSPHVAVFTNFFPDHLNYYRSIGDYRHDKSFLYRFQKADDLLVAGADIDFSGEDVRSERVPFSVSGPLPTGAFFRDDEAVLVRDDRESILFRREDIRVPGSFQAGNALAAATAAFLAGICPKEISGALRSFSGLPHHLEFVREVDGISFYDDSTATVPEAAIAALDSFPDRPILIAGGSDKGLSFDGLVARIISDTKRTVLLKGDASDRLLRLLSKRLPDEDVRNRFPPVTSMEEAVQAAVSFAKPGDTVVLSPGAASFGLFRNEFERGERFKEAVARLSGR